MSLDGKETLTYKLVKASQGISSFFLELDIFKMSQDPNYSVAVGKEDDALLAGSGNLPSH